MPGIGRTSRLAVSKMTGILYLHSCDGRSCNSLHPHSAAFRSARKRSNARSAMQQPAFSAARIWCSKLHLALAAVRCPQFAQPHSATFRCCPQALKNPHTLWLLPQRECLPKSMRLFAARSSRLMSTTPAAANRQCMAVPGGKSIGRGALHWQLAAQQQGAGYYCESENNQCQAARNGVEISVLFVDT